MRNKILIVLLVSLTFCSCDSWLNLQPEDGVIREKYWKTKEEVLSSVIGCYTSMTEDDVVKRLFVWGELRAEFISLAPSAGNDFISVVNGELTENNIYAKWGSIYKTINLCNTILAFAPEAQETDLSFSETLLHQYEAEATAIRGLMYFYLVRVFKDVPLILDASLSDDQDYRVAKTSGDVILDTIVNQLRRIEGSIPVNYGSENTTSNKGRFTLWSVKSLLADIYLWKEDYLNTANLCEQIINSGQYSLIQIDRQAEEVIKLGVSDTAYYASETDVYNYFNQVYVIGNSEESILELQFESDHANPLYGWCYPTNTIFNVNMDNMNDVFFPSSEIDRGWSDIRGEGITFKQATIWKYIGQEQNSFQLRPTTEAAPNWIFYRLSDIILMRAEALNQLAKQNGEDASLKAQALDLVKQIRVRANATETTDPTRGSVESISAFELEKFILNERAREFSFEGKRWFDVLRHAKRNNYAGTNIDYLLNVTVLAAPPEKASGLQNKLKGNYNSHYWPIYIGEINSNPNLIQNPFYIQ